MEPTDRIPDDAGGHRALVVLTDVRQDKYPLRSGDRIRIGRDAENDIVVLDASVSRFHAEILVGPVLQIRDLQSANGVRVKQQRIASNQWTTFAEGEAVQLGRVLMIARREMEAVPPPNSTDSLELLPSTRPRSLPLIEDAAMKNLYDLVERVAPSDLSVLLLGETGVGKEVIAESIHQRSERAAGPFVRIHCAALTESLIEAELFGYEKGAFTGAQTSKPGLLETANGGTVFLDELGEIPLSVQVKLLRVLQDRAVRRVGGLKTRSFDVRFVSATHRDLEAEVEKGTFRRDLYYRLKGICLRVPPLRERPSEILPLARYFAGTVRGSQAVPLFTEDVEKRLLSYSWPGNVRELRSAIDQAVVLAQGQTLTLAHFPSELSRAENRPPSRHVPDGARQSGKNLRSEWEQLERKRIVDALEQCSGNQTRAAAMLGIPRRTFLKRLEKYDIPRPRKP